MNKEPWYGKHAFWILTVLCGGLTFFADFKERVLFTAIFGLLTFFCLAMGFYYLSVQNMAQYLDRYEKAAEAQVRKKGIRVIKGGKS